MLVIPAIDLRDGRVVRLRQGDFAQSREFARDPLALAGDYAQAGASWLHVVDLDGARAGTPRQIELIGQLAQTTLHVQAGGGVRDLDDVQRLFDVGVARVVIGSLAAREPNTVAAWLERFGATRLCIALDLRLGGDGHWYPALDAWQTESRIDFASLLERLLGAGLQHVLCTDIEHDGMRAGPNLTLYRLLAARWPQIAWIASGGVRDRADVEALAGTGVAACVTGTALLEGTLELAQLRAADTA